MSVEAGADDEELLHRGVRLQNEGDLKGAVGCYTELLKNNPESSGAYNNLGNLFAGLRDWPTALTFLERAAALAPDAAEIHNNLGNLRFERKEYQAAVSSYRAALALRPNSASISNHLGNALVYEGEYAEAEEFLRMALALQPEFAAAAVNLGFLFYIQQQVEEAEVWYRRALAVDPAFALAHVCLGQILLRRGEFVAGWLEQEWRSRCKEFSSPKRAFAQPQWSGGEVRGLRVLVYAEQGIGDTLQFLRYVPLLAERGATVVLEVHPELMRLAETLGGVRTLIGRGDPVPPFDLHCPLMSLPLAFGTELETIPAQVPYLRAALDSPVGLFGNAAKGLRVGLVWAGSPENSSDGRRSIPLSAFAPLRDVPGVLLYSLQRGPASEEAPQGRFPFAGVLAQAGDFAVTAATVQQLDLVIAVDTAVAHLAGALGRPVWVLLAAPADWRWLTARDDSPWYPSARLFRQQSAGAWTPVVAEVAAALCELAREGCSS